MKNSHLIREFDACGECRLDIGGPYKYKLLSDDELETVVEALQVLERLQQPGDLQSSHELKSTRPVMVGSGVRDIDEVPAEFHGFFNAGKYLGDAGLNQPVAVVEYPDGTVGTVELSRMRFVDGAA